MTYGFIITRHVNSEQTNKYWNQCVKLIRTYYPLKKIVIIDDNSNPEFLKSDFDYKNMPVAQSAQQTLKLLDKNWQSFFASIKDYKKNPDKYTGRPKLPNYLKKNGKHMKILKLIFNL